jgi:hypothetical protein
MKDVPIGPEWYIVELVMEIIVEGSTLNVVHRNLVLIREFAAEEAYKKAIRLGIKAETSYNNPDDRLVQIKFRGISKLDALYEDPEDEAELTFEENIGVSAEVIKSWIPPKNKLGVFVLPRPGRKHNPDYRSKAIIEKAISDVLRGSDGD